MDDIDKLRDDLQSTKQMLQHELRNKEAQERENKRLLAKIQNLEAELSGAKSTPAESQITVTNGTDDGALVKSLKSEAEEAQNTSKLLEKKYQTAAEQLDAAKNEIEEQKRKLAELEKKLSGTQVEWIDSSGFLRHLSIVFLALSLSIFLLNLKFIDLYSTLCLLWSYFLTPTQIT